jgi:CTP synthase
MSLLEALAHAGIATHTQVKVHYVDAETLEGEGSASLSAFDAILVPGGFGDRGIEGKILAIRYAREENVPFLGICLGMQLAIVEAARHLKGLSGANSTEFDRRTPHPVIALLAEWQDLARGEQVRDAAAPLGGTMRLGAQEVRLAADSRARALYGQESIFERHRHRYEFNNHYRDEIGAAGLRVTGRSLDGLAECVERAEHPWFIACQFHPEFTSTPRKGHPLFTGFILAARERHHRVHGA